MTFTVHHGNILEWLPTLEADSYHGCLCDPPYHLTSIVQRLGKPGAAEIKEGTDGAFRRLSKGFMGQSWDGGDIAFRPETWAAVLRVLRPGAHLIAFGGSRTFARMSVAIEDAGFEVRDTALWLFGSGFPKSHSLAKNLAKVGMTEQAAHWNGYGTALKPAVEFAIIARKPMGGTVVETALRHGTGALNIEECRVEGGERPLRVHCRKSGFCDVGVPCGSHAAGETDMGRWPANVMHDGSDDVLEAFAAFGDRQPRGDEGSAARFFYAAKASRSDREFGLDGTFDRRPLNWSSGDQSPGTFQSDGTDRTSSNPHPCVKPTSLTEYLARMIRPPATVPDRKLLVPFAGSGSEMIGGIRAGWDVVHGCELDAQYIAIALARCRAAEAEVAAPRVKAERRRRALETRKSQGGLFD